MVVSGTSIDAVRKTRTTLEWLSNNGYRRLMGLTVPAMNYTEPAKLDGVVTKEFESLSACVAATVVLPFDRHVHEGKELGLDRLSRESRRAYWKWPPRWATSSPAGRWEGIGRCGPGGNPARPEPGRWCRRRPRRH